MGERELLKKAHEAARAEFGRSSPLRVGIILGRTWGSFPCPYKPGSRGQYLFNEGFAHSVRKRLAKSTSKEPHHG